MRIFKKSSKKSQEVVESFFEATLRTTIFALEIEIKK
jgi:hypothetical protein